MLCLCTALLTLSCTRDETAAVPQGGEPCAATFRFETEAAAGIARLERPVTGLDFLVCDGGGPGRSGCLMLPVIPTVEFTPGTSEVVFALSNPKGPKSYDTGDDCFGFSVCDSRGRGCTIVLSTNMGEWFK